MNAANAPSAAKRGQPPRIVVVGGGFCGAAFALHLARIASRPVEIAIVDPRPKLGRGVAYSSLDPVHRINVPAARMTVFRDQPAHFDQWLRERGVPDADPYGTRPNGDLFPRRSLFGDYAADQLDAAVAANPSLQFHHHVTTAVDFRDSAVLLAEGAPLAADIIVIATGNPTPELPRPLQKLHGNPRLVDNIWDRDSLDRIGSDDRVLIVGTGLTMADVVASLIERGHRGPITALSRHGIMPLRRRPGPYTVAGDFTTHPARTAIALLRAVRHAVRASKAAGEGWEPVLDAVRQQGNAIWNALSAAEKSRFLRHMRPYWDIHRLQVSPQIGDKREAAIAGGQLSIRAASIIDATATKGGIEVRSRRRGAPRAAIDREIFDVVINCTGPAIGAIVRSSPFLASLAAAGRLEPDPFGLGIAVEPDGELSSEKRDEPPALYAIGSLARGRYGELVGVRELSAQAGEVALTIARRLDLAADYPPRADVVALSTGTQSPLSPLVEKPC